MRRPSTFLVMVALVAWMVGCVGGDGSNGDGSYTLIVDFTAGGAVTVDDVPIPGKAILTYDPGTVVRLDATSSAGYRFVEWTGNATTIGDASAASINITVDGDYSITANFEPKQEDEEAPTEVRLGTTLPLTGILAGFGEQGWGMQKAVADWNEAHGGMYLSEWDVTVPIRLIIKNNESDFEQVGPLSTDLVLADEVHAFLSPWGFHGLHDATSVVANEYGVPQIIGGGPFEPWYYGSQGGVAPDYTWFSGFSIAEPQPAPSHVPGYTLADAYFTYMDMVDANTNTNKIAGVFASNDEEGAGWYNQFPQMMEDCGMEVVGVDEELGLVPMDAWGYDYTSIIHTWQDAGVEIIWGNCFAPFLGDLLAQCYTEGFRPKIIMVGRAAMFSVDVISWGSELPLGWGLVAEVWWSPSYAAVGGFVGIGGRTAASLAEDWTTEMGKPLNQFIGPGYMAAQVMLDAIARAGNVDGDVVNAALGETDLDTINGWVKFDPVTHFSAQPVSLGQWFYDEDNEDEPFTLHIVASALDFIPEEADPIFPKPW